MTTRQYRQCSLGKQMFWDMHAYVAVSLEHVYVSHRPARCSRIHTAPVQASATM